MLSSLFCTWWKKSSSQDDEKPTATLSTISALEMDSKRHPNLLSHLSRQLSSPLRSLLDLAVVVRRRHHFPEYVRDQ